MQLPVQTFTSLVQGMSAAVQAASTQLLDLTVGSVLRAVQEASASVALWMQWLILQVLQMTRAATSSGPDLDSWMADFSLTRLPAVPASGTVTFSRYNASATALVPTGTLVRTVDGSQTFAVTASPSAAGWNANLSGYLLSAGVASLDIPVVAQVAGTCGNVQAGSITVLATALAGVDTVNNAESFNDGIDAESDVAFRLRFQTFLASRCRATLVAVENAISSAQQGLNYVIYENQDAQGNARLGNFIVLIDDGSGYPATTLLQSVQQAVAAVRPVGSTFSVLPPAVTQASVCLTVAIASGANFDLIISEIVNAIAVYTNALPIGAPLPLTRIAQIAYAADPAVTNVTGLSLNGQAADLVVSSSGVIKAGSVVVS